MEIEPSLSPDGSKIAYQSNKESGLMLLSWMLMVPTRRNSTAVMGLVETQDEPSWSPDGSYIAHTLNIDGGQQAVCVVSSVVGSNSSCRTTITNSEMPTILHFPLMDPRSYGTLIKKWEVRPGHVKPRRYLDHGLQWTK
ncbi:MAG: hypothetical protein CM1200mP39_07770 [Dehalococcoidia bacterium]|nr:MAG: hypothetical protein CM1200mP39_07770 [Dehalococcoidia bacterium]